MSGRKRFIHSHPRILILLFSLFCATLQTPAAEVPLAWDPSVSPNISGYKVYVGNSSRNYGVPITVGNQTDYTVTGLADGTYYFAVTAFDSNGNESDFSNEVSTTIGTPSITCDINGDGAVNVLDLQRLANVILGINPPLSNYDLNRDLRVDVLDLQILNNVILGLRSCP